MTATGTFGCVALGNGVSGTMTGSGNLTWNNGDTSTISFSVTFATVVPVATASVTSGALQGSQIIVAPVPTGFAGNCLLAPVTTLTVGGAAVFLRL